MQRSLIKPLCTQRSFLLFNIDVRTDYSSIINVTSVLTVSSKKIAISFNILGLAPHLNYLSRQS